jgi:hypothetical protein
MVKHFQVLTVINNVSGEIGWTSTGGLNSVVAGAGVAITTINKVSTISLATVGSISAGSYGATASIPTFSINAQGQITSTGVANTYPPFQIASTSVPSTLTLDFGQNNTNWEWTLQANTVLENPVNAQPGMRGGILLRQGPTTPFALSWGSSWKFANATPASISFVASAVDYLEFTVVASNYIVVTAFLNGVG